MRKHDNKNQSQKYQKFDIIKNKQYITFVQLENNSEQKWSAFLNNYVIRLDLPRRYKIIKSIGEGSNAQVFKAKKIQYTSLDCIEEIKQQQIDEQKIPRYYALKSLNKSTFDNFESFKTLILNEINALRQLKLCDNIIQLYKVYESSSHLFMLMEYSEGGSLVDNILLNSRQDFNYDLRVADFGLSTELKPGQYLTAKCGTPTYIAPEMLQGAPYDTKVDIFALGSIMYNLITGKFLFESKRQDDILYLNKKCDLSHVKFFTKDVSYECKDLLDMLLQKNPLNRPTAREALQHPWFSSDRQALEAGLLINNYQLCPFERNQNITSLMINLNNNSAAFSQNCTNSRQDLINSSLKMKKESNSPSPNSSFYDLIKHNRRQGLSFQNATSSPQNLKEQNHEFYQINMVNKSLKNRVITITPDPNDMAGLKDSQFIISKSKQSQLKNLDESASAYINCGQKNSLISKTHSQSIYCREGEIRQIDLDEDFGVSSHKHKIYDLVYYQCEKKLLGNKNENIQLGQKRRFI
ncbi:serine threonine protein kinase [Stylonychia lemnae]|uniref:Serine threonine protein kinase n=1 Tax=Stylonychia lemnae TaxID=5949 RepID=A0A078ABW0_STYLE|nr:serine threonine protein kinase [Stylonychia lemnae]|eukprot:CDW79077.1 serine threonine protein kinase [Stylonychia lemnae]